MNQADASYVSFESIIIDLSTKELCLKNWLCFSTSSQMKLSGPLRKMRLWWNTSKNCGAKILD